MPHDDLTRSLPPARRATYAAVRAHVEKHIDPRFERTISHGMLSWVVPFSLHPAGYHANPKVPVPFLSLGAQKRHMALYMMSLYAGDEAWFRAAWKKSGKKLDLGKSCLRFETVDDLALDVLAEALRRATVDRYLAAYLAGVGAKTKGKPTAASSKEAAKAKRTSTDASAKAAPKTIGAYLARVPPETRALLEDLQAKILRVVPAAEPCISYGMPAFKIGKKVVAGFAATKTGGSFYPHSGTTLATVGDALRGRSTTKSAVHFTAEKPLSAALVAKLVRARRAEIDAG